MKRIVILLSIAWTLGIATTALASDQYVNGYMRRDGTYVQPHYQTAPDNNIYNNYSTQGNVNPYTGQAGYVNPNTQYNNPYSTGTYGRNYRK